MNLPSIARRQVHGLPVAQRYAPGTRVVTVQPDNPDNVDFDDYAKRTRRWGVHGTVTAHHDSHGLYYNVRHRDGTGGYYLHHELQPTVDD